MTYSEAMAAMKAIQQDVEARAAARPTGAQPDPDASQVAHILDDEGRARVRRGHDPQAIHDMMVDTIPRLYAPARPYLEAITETFYGVERPQSDESLDGRSLSAQDRERVIVSLLVLRNEELALAIHVYIAVALGIREEELAHIVLLAGLYGGVNTIVNGMSVLVKTLEALREAAAASEAPGLPEVMARLVPAFEGPAAGR